MLESNGELNTEGGREGRLDDQLYQPRNSRGG